MTEVQALRAFWALIRADVDRLMLLRRYAEAVIPRPDDWDRATVRAETFGNYIHDSLATLAQPKRGSAKATN